MLCPLGCRCSTRYLISASPWHHTAQFSSKLLGEEQFNLYGVSFLRSLRSKATNQITFPTAASASSLNMLPQGKVIQYKGIEIHQQWTKKKQKLFWFVKIFMYCKLNTQNTQNLPILYNMTTKYIFVSTQMVGRFHLIVVDIITWMNEL